MVVRAWVRDRRAVAAVEFAIIAPVLITLLAGAVDFNLFNYGRTKLNHAITAGSYHVQLMGNTATASDAQTFIVAMSNLPNVTSSATAPACYCIIGNPSNRQLSSATTCATLCPDGVSLSTYFMIVSGTYTYSPLMPFWDNFVGATATATATVQLQ